MHKVFRYYYKLQEDLAGKIVNEVLTVEVLIVTALFSLVCLIVNPEVSASALVAIIAVFLVSLFSIAISDYMNEKNNRIAEYIAGIAIAKGLVVGKRIEFD